jgi:hypothetical protein
LDDDDESTWLETTVEGPGTISFFYQLSCGEGDYFTFNVDNQNYFGVSYYRNAPRREFVALEFGPVEGIRGRTVLHQVFGKTAKASRK